MKSVVVATGLLVMSLVGAVVPAAAQAPDRGEGRDGRQPKRDGQTQPSTSQPQVARPQPPVTRPQPPPSVRAPLRPDVLQQRPDARPNLPPSVVQRERPDYRPQIRRPDYRPEGRPHRRPEIVFVQPPSFPVWRREFYPYEARYHDSCQRKAWRLRWYERRAAADGYLDEDERDELRDLRRDLRRTCGDFRWRG